MQLGQRTLLAVTATARHLPLIRPLAGLLMEDAVRPLADGLLHQKIALHPLKERAWSRWHPSARLLCASLDLCLHDALGAGCLEPFQCDANIRHAPGPGPVIPPNMRLGIGGSNDRLRVPVASLRHHPQSVPFSQAQGAPFIHSLCISLDNLIDIHRAPAHTTIFQQLSLVDRWLFHKVKVQKWIDLYA